MAGSRVSLTDQVYRYGKFYYPIRSTLGAYVNLHGPPFVGLYSSSSWASLLTCTRYPHRVAPEGYNHVSGTFASCVEVLDEILCKTVPRVVFIAGQAFEPVTG